MESSFSLSVRSDGVRLDIGLEGGILIHHHHHEDVASAGVDVDDAVVASASVLLPPGLYLFHGRLQSPRHQLLVLLDDEGGGGGGTESSRKCTAHSLYPLKMLLLPSCCCCCCCCPPRCCCCHQQLPPRDAGRTTVQKINWGTLTMFCALSLSPSILSQGREQAAAASPPLNLSLQAPPSNYACLNQTSSWDMTLGMGPGI